MLGWHQAADRQKRLSEATHLAHNKTAGLMLVGFFFPWSIDSSNLLCFQR